MNDQHQKRTILYIVPSTYEALERKGVVHQILERDLDGYFDRVITVHPRAPRTRVLRLDATHTVHEFGPDAVRGSADRRWLRRLQAPHYAWRVLAGVKRLVVDEGVDLIQATDPYWMGCIGVTAGKRTNVPVCVSIHADYDQRYKLDGSKGAPVIGGSRLAAKRLERYVLSRADRVLPIRQTLAEQAIRDSAREKSVRLFPHGMDTSAFTSSPDPRLLDSLGLPRNRRIISFAGRLSRENYVDDILSAAESLASRDDVLFVLAGGGKEEARLHRRVSENPNLRENVRFIGFQPRSVIAELRKASAASLAPMGGFSLIEAAAAGRPLVAYDVEWHHELVLPEAPGVW